MLGWRPAVGQEIPLRENWTLLQRLGEGGFGEVWLARHKSGERRVFKFCFEADRLRALKREVTLFRLLKEALGHRDDIARILDWHFDEAPYFVESEYTEGGSLPTWAEEQGGLAEVPLDRLTDFGIGMLTERERLDDPGFTALGFTATGSPTESAGGGTYGYLAPELMAGKAATVQADVYSLGVLLFQLVVADTSRTLAPGWERNVNDGNLDQRRIQRAEEEARVRSLQKAQRRRKLATVVASVSVVVLAIVAVMAFRENRARREAEAARERASLRQEQAEGLIGFMLGDLRKKLDGVGRLDVLDSVGDQAMRYFAAVPAKELSDEELARRSQALYQIGEVRIDQGRLEDAVPPLRESLVLAQELAQRNPEDNHRLFDLGQSHFWLGLVQFRQGKLDDALGQMRGYLTASEELVRRQPASSQWQLEVSYAQSSLGSIYEARGELDNALAAYGQNLLLTQRLLAQSPGNSDLRLELAQQHNLVGNVLRSLGRLPKAQDHFEAESRLARELTETDPQQTVWLEELAINHNYLAYLSLHRGLVEAAIRHGPETVSAESGESKECPCQGEVAQRRRFQRCGTGRPKRTGADGSPRRQSGRSGIPFQTT